ncbi:MAG: hypothetical protein D6732_27035 [Methanobacteriota archaeon]|nr:MAG: hypothetical protein D6732_27035 [Euryarchaeota archaeon]
MTLEIPNVGTLGLSRFHFTFGFDVTYIDPIDFSEKTYIPATTQYTISFSRSVWKHLFGGLNINRYTDVFRADKTTSSYPVDVGLLNYISLKQSSNRKASLALHASLTNVFSATITITEKELLPRILRLGGAFQLKQHPLDHLERLYFLAFTLVWEYQDVLDYPYRHGNKFGAELSLLEILHLRTGYYSFKIDPSPENGKGKLNDLTYGFGISLPWGTLLKSERVPITLKFDFISIGQPTYITNFDDWDNFIIYNLSVVWTW